MSCCRMRPHYLRTWGGRHKVLLKSEHMVHQAEIVRASGWCFGVRRGIVLDPKERKSYRMFW